MSVVEKEIARNKAGIAKAKARGEDPVRTMLNRENSSRGPAKADPGLSVVERTAANARLAKESKALGRTPAKSVGQLVDEANARKAAQSKDTLDSIKRENVKKVLDKHSNVGVAPKFTVEGDKVSIEVKADSHIDSSVRQMQIRNELQRQGYKVTFNHVGDTTSSGRSDKANFSNNASSKTANVTRAQYDKMTAEELGNHYRANIKTKADIDKLDKFNLGAAYDYLRDSELKKYAREKYQGKARAR